MQKFYRVNGGSTQLRGVTPDINLPDPYLYIETGEKEMDNPMPWDEIPKAAYVPLDNIKYDKLKQKSETRVKKDKEFVLVSEEAQEYKAKKDDTKYSLNLEKYMAEAKKYKDENKKYDELRKDIKGVDVSLLNVDIQRLSNDTTKLAREKKWAGNIKKDFYLNEASNVINDMK